MWAVQPRSGRSRSTVPCLLGNDWLGVELVRGALVRLQFGEDSGGGGGKGAANVSVTWSDTCGDKKWP